MTKSLACIRLSFLHILQMAQIMLSWNCQHWENRMRRRFDEKRITDIVIYTCIFAVAFLMLYGFVTVYTQ